MLSVPATPPHPPSHSLRVVGSVSVVSEEGRTGLCAYCRSAHKNLMKPHGSGKVMPSHDVANIPLGVGYAG